AHMLRVMRSFHSFHFIILCLCCFISLLFLFFFFNDPATTEIYTLSLHDALPISTGSARGQPWPATAPVDQRVPVRRGGGSRDPRSEEHTSELQSLAYLVCRLLLEKKKKKKI